ncbi:hypothetical protein F6455_07245 [Proteobacteria bacterium 005FR1]|nr:hypothetical protein [Proteobacteria bacterium 005FR1]
MTHAVSPEDQRFRAEFEAGTLRAEDFDQRSHVRLAYVYLVDNSTATALALLRQALQSYLNHKGIELSRHHETMSRAWILAVREFMDGSPPARSADEFMQRNPSLLDAETMSSQYSTGNLLHPQ